MKLTRLCLCLLFLMCSVPLVADNPAPLPPGYKNDASVDNPPLPPAYGGDNNSNSGAVQGFGPPLQAPAFTKVIPQLDIDGLPLNEVINVLQKNEPDFQAVIRYSGDSQDSPPVKLQLKNVTVTQVIEVLAKKYGWGIEGVQTPGHPPIYVIAVREQKQPEWNVSAYCLTPIIDKLLDRKGYSLAPIPADLAEAQQKMDEVRKKDRNAVLADVVATVNTAVTMASEGEAVTLQVHEPTEMLIIKSTPKQREAAEHVLKALDPGSTVVKAEGPDFAHRADPFSSGAGSSSSGNVDPLIVREAVKMLESQQNLEGKGDKAESDLMRRLHEKRIKELQQDLQQQGNPAPATQPHVVPPAPPKD